MQKSLPVRDAGLCAGGKGCLYRVTELIAHLLEANVERPLLRMRQQLGKLDLLTLDELGYVAASKVEAKLLLDVVAKAYERNSSSQMAYGGGGRRGVNYIPAPEFLP